MIPWWWYYLDPLELKEVDVNAMTIRMSPVNEPSKDVAGTFFARPSNTEAKTIYFRAPKEAIVGVRIAVNEAKLLRDQLHRAIAAASATQSVKITYADGTQEVRIVKQGAGRIAKVEVL